MTAGARFGGSGAGLLLAGVLLIVAGFVLRAVGADGGGSGGGASSFLHEAVVADDTVAPGGGPPRIRVLKTATCGCCSGWVDHLRQNGLEVAAEDVTPEALRAAKEELGIPEGVRSCHTAAAGGYLIEGHVPGELIRRVLEERPEIEGLAVPDMPVGSPGMDGAYDEPYDVLALLPDGRTEVYASR